MKKILILNVLAAVLLAANARAEGNSASAQLFAAAAAETELMPLPVPGFFGEPAIACAEGYTAVTLGASTFCLPADSFNWPPNPALPDSFVYEAEIAPAYFRAYAAQAAARKAVAEAVNIVSDREAFLKSGKVRVTADEQAVYLVSEGRILRLNDRALAAKVRKLVGRPADAAQAGNKFLFYVGAAAAIDCMTDDACWGAVGDAVSAVSEWANS